MTFSALEICGWIGAISLAICGAPQAYRSLKTQSSDGISNAFLILWGIGELLTLVYILPKWDWPLIANYTVNIIFIGIIARYKFR
jgi:uncharacterized protein with PQ loop repeat